MNDFSKVPKVEATESPEEGPLPFLWAEGGVWMPRRSGDVHVPRPLTSVFSLVSPYFLRYRPEIPHGSLEVLGVKSPGSVASHGALEKRSFPCLLVSGHGPPY